MTDTERQAMLQHYIEILQTPIGNTEVTGRIAQELSEIVQQAKTDPKLLEMLLEIRFVVPEQG